MKTDIGVIITKSFQRAKLVLFSPFALKKWLILLFIAAMAGALSSGGGNFGNYGTSSSDESPTNSTQSQTPTQGNVCPAKSSGGHDAFIVAGLITAAIVIFALLIFFSWLGARFRFVWFDAVVKNDASIIEPFRRYREQGDSLFAFSMILLFFVILFFAALIGWGIWWANAAGFFAAGAKPEFWDVLKVITLPLIVGFCGLLVLAIFSVVLDHFLVSIMVLDNCAFKQSWQRFVVIFKSKTNEFLMYFLILFCLCIAANLASLFVVILLVLLILIAGLIIFGPLYLITVAVLKLQVIFNVLAVVLAIPFVIVAIILLMSVNLPLAVFFRSFSLYFLAGLDCGYKPWGIESPVCLNEQDNLSKG